MERADGSRPVPDAADLALLVAASSSCVLVHDALTKAITWASPAACAALGYRLGELTARTAPRTAVAADRDDRLIGGAWLQEALDHGESRIEWLYRSRSGELVPTEARACRVELASGPVVMVEFRVVEADQKANGALSDTASYVEALSRHTAAGLLVLAPDGVVLHATDLALVQFGDRVRSDVVGAPITRYCHITTAIDAAVSRQGWPAAVAAADPIGSIQLRLGDEDHRSTWLGGTLERLTRRGGDVLLLTVHDISDRVQDQRRRALELQQENYAARYNVMGDMAMAIAHELGQPLAAAGNYLAGVRTRASALAVKGSLPLAAAAQFDFGLENAHRQIDRVSTIVATLRAFVGHLEHIEQTVDLNEVVEQCLYFVRLRAAEHAVRVDVDLSVAPVVVRCERVLTGQVVLNLCFNAVDELAECPVGDRQLTIRTRLDADGGEVVVEDQGRGFPRDPFAESFTLKEYGSGIGLALSHRIITRQHGTIWAEPREGGGSRFGFSLPVPDGGPRGVD